MRLTRDKIPHSQITVLGAARSGVDVAILLKKAGAIVFLSEKAPRSEKETQAVLMENHAIPFEFGGHTKRIFNADAFVTSPGIPDTNPLLQEAKSRHIEVLGELEVASWFCSAKLVAITGSNGKSTTTMLIGEMVKHSGMPCIIAGNIGTSFSSQVESLHSDGIAVVEVSNFQLETIRDFHPNIAVFLNLTPDHLDRHGNIETYGRIKASIFKNQTQKDVAIYNGQDSLVTSYMQDVQSQKKPFQISDPHMDGAFVENGSLMLRKNGDKVFILDENDMGIRGPHNIKNGLAAALAADSLGVPFSSIAEVLSTFHGLPHRMERIREIDSVEWINDSKATNIDSMQCAIQSFNKPVVLIAGGRDKDSDFSILKPLVKEKIRSVILIGEAAEKIQKAWQNVTSMITVNSMADAVENARCIAQKGDVVLLSPGCASFDMFENFEDRGDQFKTLVKSI